MDLNRTTHIGLLSGGLSSALVAIYLKHTFGVENMLLINHDIKTGIEHEDIKRFKKEIANYIGVPLIYANYNGISNPDELPDQFDISIDKGAFTNQKGDMLCTHYLKTKPFIDWLWLNYLPHSTLFEEKKECIIYYGFDNNEIDRVQRRSGIMGAKGYRTDYPVFKGLLKITDTRQIGIEPPLTYSTYKHANCKGCLKAGLLHWYVTYVDSPDIYDKASHAESEIGFYIHTITRNGITRPISLEELRVIYEKLKQAGVPATEHQSAVKFGLLLRQYEIEECNINAPCDCTGK